MRELVFTNRMEEIKLERHKEQLLQTKSPIVKKQLKSIIAIIKSQIDEREAMYQKIASGEINYTEKDDE